MFSRVNRWVGGAVLLASAACASVASAQVSGGVYNNNGQYLQGGSNGSLGFYGFGYYNYGTDVWGTGQRPPFYAVYPPVYYSQPVARTYGWSPFAYPPGVLTPEVVPPQTGAIYRNPFVPKKGEAKPVENKTAHVGKFYINPFVAQSRTASKASLAENAPH